MCVCVCVCVRVYVCLDVCVCMHACILECIHVYMYACMDACIHVSCADTHARTHPPTHHSRTHEHAHIHIHKVAQFLLHVARPAGTQLTARGPPPHTPALCSVPFRRRFSRRLNRSRHAQGGQRKRGIHGMRGGGFSGRGGE